MLGLKTRLKIWVLFNLSGGEFDFIFQWLYEKKNLCYCVRKKMENYQKLNGRFNNRRLPRFFAVARIGYTLKSLPPPASTHKYTERRKITRKREGWGDIVVVLADDGRGEVGPNQDDSKKGRGLFKFIPYTPFLFHREESPAREKLHILRERCFFSPFKTFFRTSYYTFCGIFKI